MSLPDANGAGRMGRAAAWSTGAAVVNQAIRFGLFVALSRLVSPLEFGIVALAAILVDFLGSVGDGGVFDAAVQRKTLSAKAASTVFWLLIAMGLVLFAVVAALSPVVAWIFRTPEVAPVLVLMSVSLIIGPLGAVNLILMNRALAFRRLALWSLAASVVGGGVGIALAALGHGVLALAARSVVSICVTVGLAWIGSPWKPRLEFDRALAADLLRFGGSLLAGRVVGQVNARGIELIAGLMIAPAAVGFLRVGGQCVNLLTQLTLAPLTQIGMPLLARASHEPDQWRDAVRRFASLSGLIIYPAFFGAMAISGVAIPFVFGSQWEAASQVFLLLCLLAAPLHISLLLTAAFTARGKGRAVFRWSLVQALVGLPLAAIGGVMGLYPLICLAVFKSYLLLPLGFHWLNREGDVDWHVVVGGAWRPLLASIVMAAVVLGVSAMAPPTLPALATLAALIGVGVGVFITALLMIDADVRAQVGVLYHRWRAPGGAVRSTPPGSPPPPPAA